MEDFVGCGLDEECLCEVFELFFFLRRSGSVEVLLSRLVDLERFVFLRRDSSEVELDVVLLSSLLELDSVVEDELLFVEEELLPFLIFLSFFFVSLDSIFI